MTERRNIGDILMATGRVTNEDVLRAVDYQRANGGYLGEALVALGCLTPEELRWSLASQFDLPYVFPDPDSIDPEAAALVTPEWALSHLALPIMKTDETLTVVVDSPLKSRAVEELQARTDLDVQLALASSWKIRELVRQVYARHAPAEGPTPAAALKVDAAIASAIQAGSRRFGISTRGNSVWFWYDEEGTVHRRPLDADWREGLDRIVSPKPSELFAAQRHAPLAAELTWQGFQHPVELRYLSSGPGEEYLFTPVRAASTLEDRFPAPPASVLSEIRLLARSGSARFLVFSDPPELAGEILPHLPTLLLDPSWRSVHLLPWQAAEPRDEVFTVTVPTDPDRSPREIEALRTFHFDAISVDGRAADPEWALGALDAASVAFVLANERTERRSAFEAGIRWELRIERSLGESLTWSLEPLQA
jgi:hypothetical protein